MCSFAQQLQAQLSASLAPAVERLFELSCLQLELCEDQMFLLGRKTAREKVQAFLLAYGDRMNRDGQGQTRCVNLPMTRADIADFRPVSGNRLARTLKPGTGEAYFCRGFTLGSFSQFARIIHMTYLNTIGGFKQPQHGFAFPVRKYSSKTAQTGERLPLAGFQTNNITFKIY